MGKRAVYIMPPMMRVSLASSGRAGIVAEGDTEVEIVSSTTGLALLRAKGRMVEGLAAELGDDKSRELVFQANGVLKRLSIPTDPNVRITRFISIPAWGTALVLSESEKPGARISLYDASTGQKLLGLDTATPSYTPSWQRTDDRLVVARNGSLGVYDLATGRLVESIPFGCPSGESGNPIRSPGGTFHVATCGADLVVSKRGQATRRLSRVMPGCDNGMNLSGLIRENAPATLEIQGCGGIARIDLDKARYACADNDGVAGAAYMMVPGGTGPLRPPGRAGLPKCTDNPDGSFFQELGHSNTYELDGQTNEIVYGKVRRKLESRESDQGPTPTLSPQEDRVAYRDGHTIVIKSLPDWKDVLRYDSVP